MNVNDMTNTRIFSLDSCHVKYAPARDDKAPGSASSPRHGENLQRYCTCLLKGEEVNSELGATLLW
jgi:hypothetical protein